MSAIQILLPQVAERIATGEVVERPASVVKELDMRFKSFYGLAHQLELFQSS